MNNFVIKNVFVCGANVHTTTQPADKVEQWKEFIRQMRATHTSLWDGDSFGGFYGLVNGRFDFFREDEIPSHVKVITIEEFFEQSESQPQEEQEPEEEQVLDYLGNFIPLSTARQFSEHSVHAGQYFSPNDDDIRKCDYGDGYAHNDEISYDIDDNCFITYRAEYHNLTWSDYNNQWICTDDDYVYYGYYNGSNYQDYFYSDETVVIGGEYYADSGVANSHGFYWSERMDGYLHEDDNVYSDEDDVEANNSSYHGLTRLFRFDMHNPPSFSVGFEIEKEDSDAGTICYRDLYNTTGWCKENDGSLNNNGYELISPAFDLYSNQLEKEVKDSNDLQRLIAGEFSHRCGGHINVASSDYTPDQLFEGLSGFFPLLYAIYPHRVSEDYCRAKKKHEYYRKEKRSAVYIKDSVVEFRIFPAVRNYNNLIWRRDLMRIMCDNVNKSESDVLKMLVNSNTKLHKHMRKIYTHEALMDRVERFIDHCTFYNNKKLNKLNIVNKKKIEATGVNTDDLAC